MWERKERKEKKREKTATGSTSALLLREGICLGEAVLTKSYLSDRRAKLCLVGGYPARDSNLKQVAYCVPVAQLPLLRLSLPLLPTFFKFDVLQAPLPKRKKFRDSPGIDMQP